MRRCHLRNLTVAVLLLTPGGIAPSAQRNEGALDPAAGRAILRQVRDELSRQYYDPRFGGRSLDQLFASAEERLAAARSTSDMFSAIALPLLDLEDPHTLFLPPARATQIRYGMEMAAIGDRIFVTSVESGSDAAAQGIRAGDEMLVVNTLQPTRADLWKIRYILLHLRPQPALALKLRRPDGSEREVTARAAAVQRRRLLDLTSLFDLYQLERDIDAARDLFASRDHAIGADILIWKMAAFTPDTNEIDRMIRRARGFKTLILDLRGNGGGALIGLERLASQFFDKPVAIATTLERRRTREYRTRPPRQPFTGRLIVLTDSRSASAAEMFARLIQLQQRGVVIGDRTAGSVMRSRIVPLRLGLDRVVLYAISVTLADVLMPDGGRLERVGVTPDELILPTPEDLRDGLDQVLALAVTRAGGTLSPRDAGALWGPAQPTK
jgi:C-terminal processing protease CtpA/Prc